MNLEVKKIGVVTGTRADFGLLSRVILLMQNHPYFDLTVFVTGTHLSADYGYTINEIRDMKIQNIVSVESLVSSVSRVGLVKSVGLATIGFADAFSQNSLDAIVVLGDRFEILAASQTAMLLGIPLIHIHGGEITEGAFDDSIRHAITKMANLHFVATTEFANRVMQMGEPRNSVFVVGATGVDNILHTQGMPKSQLEADLGISLDSSAALVTYHAVTNADDIEENNILPLVEAIKDIPDITYIITYPNADGYGDEIVEYWKTLSALENVILVPSLGFKRYLSLMKYVDCVIGNSSSGILEAPSFKVATVNIGTRQKGRPCAESVINVSMNKNAICEAINKCRTEVFKKSLEKVVSPYGEGGASEEILKVISEQDLRSFKAKKFMDI